MRLYFALWALFYSLLESCGSLRPNFLHKFHGQSRSNQRKHDDFDINAVTEMIVVIICFMYSRPCFPTTEVIRKIRDIVNEESEARRYFSLRTDFNGKLLRAEAVFKEWDKDLKDLLERSLDLLLDESERESARAKHCELSEAHKTFQQRPKDFPKAFH